MKATRDMAASYGPAPEPYRPLPAAPAPYQPLPYQPPTLGFTQPGQTVPPPIAVGSTGGPQVRYLPPQSFSSTSLVTPTPSFSSTSLIGPQRADWKPGGGF